MLLSPPKYSRILTQLQNLKIDKRQVLTTRLQKHNRKYKNAGNAILSHFLAVLTLSFD